MAGSTKSQFALIPPKTATIHYELHLNIFRTYKQIYDEASRVFYENNEFAFSCVGPYANIREPALACLSPDSTQRAQTH
jgi:hypothetical protein